MFCSKCGNKMAEGADFCNKCGTKRQADAAVTEKAASHTHSTTAPKVNAPSFVAGDLVLAKWSDGFYHHGNIMEIRENQAHVRFHNSKLVWAKLSKLVEPSRASANMVFEAIWDDAFYICEVLDVTANTAKVRYVDDGIESEVSLSDIRASYGNSNKSNMAYGGEATSGIIGQIFSNKRAIITVALLIIGAFVIFRDSSGEQEAATRDRSAGLEYVINIADDIIRFPSGNEGRLVPFNNVRISSVNRRQSGIFYYDRVGLGAFDFEGANVMVFLNGPLNDDIGFMVGDIVSVYGTFLSLQRNPIPLINEYAFIFNIADAPAP